MSALAVGTLVVAEGVRRYRRMARTLTACTASMRSLRSYERLVESATDFLWTCDLEGRFTYVNAAVARALGCTRRSLIGHSSLDFLPGPPNAYDLHGLIDRLRSHKSVKPIVLESTSAHGRRWVEVLVAGIFDETGGLCGLQGMCHDLTERVEFERRLRRSERRYRAIVDLQRTLVSRLEPDGRLTFVNPAVCRLCGKTAQELVGASTLPLIHEADMPQVERAMHDVVRSPYHVAVEIRVRGAHGTRTLVLEGDAIRDSGGRVVEIQVVGRDVTDERRLEASSRHAGRFRILGTVAAGLAHEINNPAAAILMQARRALEDQPAMQRLPELRGALEAIAREAKRCGQIAHRVLRLAVARDSDRRAIDLNEVVRSVASDSRAYLADRGVHLGTKLAPELPRVHADAVEIELLLANLIQNAVATGTAPLAIWIRTARTETGAQLAVEDDGPGIAPELREQVFELGRTGAGRQGTGLGLAFCREIASAHGGRIEVRSGEGRGTAILVDLPPAPESGP